MFVQLPLKIGLREEVCFDTFIAEEEGVVLALNRFQQTLLKSNNGDAFYFQGESGSGKTHILQAACRFMTEKKSSSVYLPLGDESLPLIPDVLNGLEQTLLVCLDDVENIIGQPEWEHALTSLLMRSKELGHKVVLSGTNPAGSWSIATTELTHAMMSVLPITLKPLTNKPDIVLAMQRHALKLGFELPLDVGNYLIKQFSTDLQELLSVLRILEQATFVEKRRMTLPFVKQILTKHS